MANRSEIENLNLRNSDDLCELAQMLGYDTQPQQLILNNGASVSGLLNFFDDNPGAMEAVKNWILDNSNEVEKDSEETCDEEDDA